MWCVLVFVGYGHTFVNKYGTLFYKACYYDCGAPGGKNGQWYDKRHVVHPDAYCPARYMDT
jgi:hypothetical protein